jgi:hypothetical protein
LTRGRPGPKLRSMTTLHMVRLALVAAGVTVAAPTFASVVPLCGEHEKGKDTNADKSKNESNKDGKKEEKKPANPA